MILTLNVGDLIQKLSRHEEIKDMTGASAA